MKRLTVLSSAIALAWGWQLAQAQPPGGGGFTPPTFDSINLADEDGNKDDHLTVEEVATWFEELMAGFGGRGGGGQGAGGRGGGFNAETIFARWDTDPEGGDGKVTEAEFDARQQGGGGRGFGGRGGGGAQTEERL